MKVSTLEWRLNTGSSQK